MRIATLSNAQVIHTRRWVEHFRARGHEVALWSLEPGPAALDARPLPRLPLPGFLRYPLAAGALRAQLERFRPDLVDAHFVPNYGLLGAVAGRGPLAVTAWGSDLLVAVANPLQRARVRFVLARAGLVLADSDNLGAAARRFCPRPERIRVVPWGIDLERFRDRGERTPRLLLSTRMHEPVYDIPTLLRAAQPVLERHADAFLAITGEGTLTPELRTIARELLPAARHRFLGRLDPDSLAGWLARADVYLSASRSDSTSLSLLEAMASGAIPVVSAIDGNREWVADGDGARLFAVGDVEDAARALERALGEPEWARAARARNRRVVEARADWNANMAEVESLFEALAAGRALPEPSGSEARPR